MRALTVPQYHAYEVKNGEKNQLTMLHKYTYYNKEGQEKGYGWVVYLPRTLMKDDSIRLHIELNWKELYDLEDDWLGYRAVIKCYRSLLRVIFPRQLRKEQRKISFVIKELESDVEVFSEDLEVKDRDDGRFYAEKTIPKPALGYVYRIRWEKVTS